MQFIVLVPAVLLVVLVIMLVMGIVSAAESIFGAIFMLGGLLLTVIAVVTAPFIIYGSIHRLVRTLRRQTFPPPYASRYILYAGADFLITSALLMMSLSYPGTIMHRPASLPFWIGFGGIVTVLGSVLLLIEYLIRRRAAIARICVGTARGIKKAFDGPT